MPASQTIPIVARARAHPDRQAIIATDGSFCYRDLLDLSARAAARLLDGVADLDGARVAFIVPPSMAYVTAQWGTWRAGGVAVPLCVIHPVPELIHVIDDSQASIVVAHPDFEQLVRPLAEERRLRFLLTTELSDAEPGVLPRVAAERNAMLVYTSGTTGRPKGAVSTHQIIGAQVGSIVDAWGWNAEDRALHVLPLHHVHGIVNSLCCALWSGASCEILPRFDAIRVWERITDSEDLTLFMAVPTIYARLISEWDAAPPTRRARMSDGCRRLRVMISGSAALPVPMLERWRAISGHTLLERYGMTEIGMALTNPLHGERMPGYVGSPFPSVRVRLVDEDGRPVGDGQPGQIHVAGPTIFKGYWNKPEATDEVFTEDGWFKTGDIAIREHGIYRILGRESTDILKTGGFKVSSLEIEAVLREHEDIAECAVVGVPDDEWGQRVGAAVVLTPGASLDLEQLRSWGKQRLAAYKVPTLLLRLEELPRNPMGKVTKPEVARLFEGGSEPGVD